MEAKTPVRILVADDHPVVREGLVMILTTQPDFFVAGEAATGSEAIQKVLDTQPDVLLLDLEMPDLDGVEVLRRLCQANSPVKALVFTAYDTDERILAAIQLGAQGYLLKGAPREQIFQAIRLVASGGSLLEPVIAMKLIRQVAGSDQNEDSSERNEPLTDREIEVLSYLSQGKTNKEIARELVITERTVKFHVSSILAKLNAGNRTEAVKTALQRRLIQL
ncbi:MAG: response regulator [Omnitrophica WOR_2 bacterium]